MSAQPAQPSDPFAGGTTVPSISFKDMPIGTTFSGTVTEAPQLIQARDFDTGQPAFFPDGNAKMTVVTKLALEPTGEERSLWAAKPSAMFAAIAQAQKDAGTQIAVGGHLSVTFSGEKPNEKNPRLNKQKLYTVVYRAPDAFTQQPAQAPQQAQRGWQAPPQTPPPAFAQPAPQQAAPAPQQWSPEQIAAAKQAGIPLPGVDN